MKILKHLSVLSLVLFLAVPAFADTVGKYEAQVSVGSNKVEDQTNQQVGIDLEKRGENFGYGLMLNRETQAQPQSEVGLGLFFHPGEHLEFKAGPAVLMKEGEDNKTVLEAGVEYDWNFRNGWQVGPEINTNFGDGNNDSYNYGISLGKQF